MDWNKNQVGNIFTRKKILMARINGIQKAIASKPSSFLLKLEVDLLRDLDLILNQEEELWALKSRVNWLVQGDRNTAFFHVSTLVRRKRNQIMAIKNSMGGSGSLRRMISKSLLEAVLMGYTQYLMRLFRGMNLVLSSVRPASRMGRGRESMERLLKQKSRLPCGL